MAARAAGSDVNETPVTDVNVSSLFNVYMLHAGCFRTLMDVRCFDLKAADLPIVDIHELKEKTERITGKPAKLSKGDRVVAEVIGRNGDLQDQIFNVK